MGVLASALLCALLCTPAMALASPLELYGFGARSSAMAGGGVASAHSFDCVYLNPAGLGPLREKYVAGGLSFGKLDLRLNGQASGGDDTLATTFGLVVPLPLKGSMRDRLTLGLGIIVPQNAVARARAPAIGEPTFALLDSRSEVVGIQVAMGYVLGPRMSIGAGVLALGTLVGAIQVDVDGAGRFITRSEQELRSDFAPVLGLRYRPRDEPWRTGLSLRGASSAGFDVEVNNTLGTSLPLSLPPLRLVGVPQYDPASLSAELDYELVAGANIALQLDYKHWSAFPRPTNNPLATGEVLAEPDFHDTLVPRLSGEWRQAHGAVHLAARAGYAFIYSPAPEMSGAQSLVDNHRHLLATGLGVDFPDSDFPFQIDAWMQVHQLIARTHNKDAQQVVDSGAIDSIRGTGRIIIAGVTLGVRL